ncbi:hypothetical protein IAD21_04667 [Abditibacteriota bacterium]|nr:hypothetical protein IAD21_04667 [Abditibacteriota bacterium]
MAHRVLPSYNTKPFFLAACLLALSLRVFAQTVLAQNATIGDPTQPATLRAELQNAYISGARTITIRPGVYNIPRQNENVFHLDHWRNARINAYNTTLIFDEEDSHPMFVFDGCTNVTLSGAILSQKRLTAYQGHVVAVSDALDGKVDVDWQPSAGYPVPPRGASKISASCIAPNTHLYKPRVGDFWDTPQRSLGNNTWRLHCDWRDVNCAVGDLLIGRYDSHPFKVLLWQSHNCTLRDLTLWHNGFSTIREDGFGGGGNHIIKSRWTPGPRPDGATEDSLVCAAADGLHSTLQNPGPEIDGCVFEGILHDDPIAIHGAFQEVSSVRGNTITVQNGYACPTPGQPLRIYNSNGYLVDVMVVAVTDNGDGTITITLDSTYNVPIGAKIVNPLACGAGYRITNCLIRGTRSRGIICKADKGYIAGNIIEDNDIGIQLGPEYYWNEADYVRGTIIERNTFRRNGYTGYGNPAILIRGEGTFGNRNNIIRQNQFLGNFGGDINVAWNAGLVVSDNLFTAPSPLPTGFSRPPCIYLDNVRNVTLRGNSVTNPSAYKAPLIGTESVSGIDGNNSSGMRFEGNKVFNASFDTTNATSAPSGWVASGANPEASYTDSTAGARSGVFHLTHWKERAYSVSTFQRLERIPSGLYTLRAWVRSSGGQPMCQMEVGDYGGPTLQRNITASTLWTQISLTDIAISNGQCRLGFVSQAQAKQWLHVDDVELVQQ